MLSKAEITEIYKDKQRELRYLVDFLCDNSGGIFKKKADDELSAIKREVKLLKKILEIT